jgi:hypothetical protein
LRVLEKGQFEYYVFYYKKDDEEPCSKTVTDELDDRYIKKRMHMFGYDMAKIYNTITEEIVEVIL